MSVCKYCGELLEIKTLKNGEDVYYCPKCNKGFCIPTSSQSQSKNANIERQNTEASRPVVQQKQTGALSDVEEIKECFEDVLIVVDESPNYNLDFYRLLTAIVEKMQKHYNNLSITERAAISLYYDAIILTTKNLKPFYNMGARGMSSVNAMVPTLKSHATNAYAKLC